MFQTALVMLAFDERDTTVLAAVRALTPSAGIERLLVAHVYAQDPFPPWVDPATPAAPLPERPAALDAALEGLIAALPNVEVVGLHAVGSPAEELQRIIASEDVDLLVIGRNGASNGKPGWGPSGRQLIRGVTCSVFVVPVTAQLNLSHATVGLDFSERSIEALQVASGIAHNAVGVYRHEQPERAARVQSPEADGSPTSVTTVRDKALAHFEAEVVPQFEGRTTPSLWVGSGASATDALLEHAKGGLIVVGSRGLSRLATVLLGSTAESVAGLAAGPVLIVRRKGESRSLVAGLLHR
jgi:nucleotide-binding universal stress UspA family protein